MDSDPSTPQRSRLTRLPSLRPLASDKLFYFLFHSNPDLILRWLEDLPASRTPVRRPHSCPGIRGAAGAVGGAATQ